MTLSYPDPFNPQSTQDDITPADNPTAKPIFAECTYHSACHLEGVDCHHGNAKPPQHKVKLFISCIGPPPPRQEAKLPIGQVGRKPLCYVTRRVSHVKACVASKAAGSGSTD